MRIAIVCSNYSSINNEVKKGTEIFDYILIDNLIKNNKDINITAFASGDSDLAVKIESVDYYPSISDKGIIKNNKHIIFELALLSKAFSMQDNFDLYHINIGDGDIALPFVPFVQKPILITLHYTQDEKYIDKYFSFFKDFKNVYFVSISDAQRKFFPKLNYAATIYHGIELEKFQFSAQGGKKIMWAGRGVPDKGLEIVLEVLKKTEKEASLFPLRKSEYLGWLNKLISNHQDLIAERGIHLEFDKDRYDLIPHYQTSKLFLFPIQWEEPFGLVLIEAMACGTPVVAYARGSAPEIIKDGETGFLINPEDGVKGLCEAVDKIYSMPEMEYQKMRQNCRSHVEKSFSANRMAEEYLKAYNKIVKIV